MIVDREAGPDWNVVAVSTEFRTGAAQRALSEFGRFRSGGFPRVMVGRVAEPERLRERLVAIDGASEEGARSDPLLRHLSRLVPMERTLVFEREDVTEAICEELEAVASRLAGKSFFVRTKLRGLKGRLEHPVVERAIGAFLVGRSSSAGGVPARVSFSDPDEVVVVEVVGVRVGYAFLDRETRRLPLMGVR